MLTLLEGLGGHRSFFQSLNGDWICAARDYLFPERVGHRAHTQCQGRDEEARVTSPRNGELDAPYSSRRWRRSRWLGGNGTCVSCEGQIL